MNSRASVTKSLVVAAALVAGVSGVARADDNSLSRFGGDGYAYFGGDKPIASKASSAFRHSNPQGLSLSQYQGLSSEGPAWHPAPVAIDKSPSTFRRTYPHGLSERELQALSSDGPAWHSSPQSAPSSLAITRYGVFADRAVSCSRGLSMDVATLSDGPRRSLSPDYERSMDRASPIRRSSSTPKTIWSCGFTQRPLRDLRRSSRFGQVFGGGL